MDFKILSWAKQRILEIELVKKLNLIPWHGIHVTNISVQFLPFWISVVHLGCIRVHSWRFFFSPSIIWFDIKDIRYCIGQMGFWDLILVCPTRVGFWYKRYNNWKVFPLWNLEAVKNYFSLSKIYWRDCGKIGFIFYFQSIQCLVWYKRSYIEKNQRYNMDISSSYGIWQQWRMTSVCPRFETSSVSPSWTRVLMMKVVNCDTCGRTDTKLQINIVKCKYDNKIKQQEHA